MQVVLQDSAEWEQTTTEIEKGRLTAQPAAAFMARQIFRLP